MRTTGQLIASVILTVWGALQVVAFTHAALTGVVPAEPGTFWLTGALCAVLTGTGAWACVELVRRARTAAVPAVPAH